MSSLPPILSWRILGAAVVCFVITQLSGNACFSEQGMFLRYFIRRRRPWMLWGWNSSVAELQRDEFFSASRSAVSGCKLASSDSPRAIGYQPEVWKFVVLGVVVLFFSILLLCVEGRKKRQCDKPWSQTMRWNVVPETVVANGLGFLVEAQAPSLLSSV